MTLTPSLISAFLAGAALPFWAATPPATVQVQSAAPDQAGKTATAAYAAPDPYRDQRILPDPHDPASRNALLRARGEADHRAEDSRQTEEELRTTRALNDEVAAQNALADKAHDAARLDYETALARHQIEVRRAEEQARADAEATRAAQEQYDRDYAAWREQVRLCQSGFREACSARPAWVRPQ